MSERGPVLQYQKRIYKEVACRAGRPSNAVGRLVSGELHSIRFALTRAVYNQLLQDHVVVVKKFEHKNVRPRQTPGMDEHTGLSKS